MTTVTAVKRALEEAAKQSRELAKPVFAEAFETIAYGPTALTILANRLRDSGKAGNEAARRNLFDLQRIAADLRFTVTRVGNQGCRARLEAADKLAALEWAIEQLTPPEKAQP